MNKDEILFSLSLTHTVIIVARDKIENVSALIYNIVISMTYLSLLSDNRSGESMGIKWSSYLCNQRFVVKIFEHCFVPAKKGISVVAINKN